MLKKQYEFILLDAPVAFLRKNRKSLHEDCPFSNLHRAILERFYKLGEVDPPKLINAILKCAADPHIEIGPNNLPYFYGRFLGTKLGQIAEPSWTFELVDLCFQNKICSGRASTLLHESLRCRTDVDVAEFLPKIGRVGFPLNDAIVNTVQILADETLVEEITRVKGRMADARRICIAEAISTIKHESVKELYLAWLGKFRNKEDLNLFYSFMLQIADQEILEVLEQRARRGQYASNIIDLPRELLTLQVIMEGDLEGVSSLSREMVKRDRADRLRMDLLYAKEAAKRVGFDAPMGVN